MEKLKLKQKVRYPKLAVTELKEKAGSGKPEPPLRTFGVVISTVVRPEKRKTTRKSLQCSHHEHSFSSEDITEYSWRQILAFLDPKLEVLVGTTAGGIFTWNPPHIWKINLHLISTGRKCPVDTEMQETGYKIRRNLRITDLPSGSDLGEQGDLSITVFLQR